MIILNFFGAFYGVFLNHSCHHKTDTVPKNGKKFHVLFAGLLNIQFTKDLEVNCSSLMYYATFFNWYISHHALNMIRILLILRMLLTTSSVKTSNLKITHRYCTLR